MLHGITNYGAEDKHSPAPLVIKTIISNKAALVLGTALPDNLGKNDLTAQFINVHSPHH